MKNNSTNFNIVFEKLAEAVIEQNTTNDLSETDLSNIDESIHKLLEIQRCIDTYTYTYFTRT